jgi:hypothetical protein
MKTCTEYYKKRSELAEKYIVSREIGDFKEYTDFSNKTEIIHNVNIDGECIECKEKK